MIHKRTHVFYTACSSLHVLESKLDDECVIVPCTITYEVPLTTLKKKS
jgi:hypothetical protein